MMNIFTAFDEAYVLPTRVMLKSLIENQSDALTIYVFYSSLSRKSIDAVRQLEEPGRVSFFFKQVEDSFLGELSIPKQFSKEIYYRLFAHHLFPEDVKKALWLDGDIIINGSLSEFYNQDFQGKIFIAIKDCDPIIAEKKRIILDMTLDSKYINSGVMLFDLKAMRETLNDQEIIQYMTENQEILEFADQEVFNGLLHEHILVVDPDRRYNYSCWYITEENQAEVYRNARVIHYCGSKKPWKEDFSLLPPVIWWEYALKTGPEYLTLFIEIHCYIGELRRVQNEIEKCNSEINTLQYDLDCVRSSVSFRIGRALTFLPRKLRGGIRCLKENGLRYTISRTLFHFGLRKWE